MKIALLSNWWNARCGVAEHGRLLRDALREAGHTVYEWEDSEVYPGACDLLHVNWHPMTLGPLVPSKWLSWANHTPISVYLHDVPPHSQCPITGFADAVFAPEPYAETTYLPYPAIRNAVRAPAMAYDVGTTGIRQDGHGALQTVCDRHGWSLSLPPDGAPTSTRDEVLRLSLCKVLVQWYWASGRGKSLGVMTCASALRPVLCSGSEMFSEVRGYEGIQFAGGSSVEELDCQLTRLLSMVGVLRLPTRLVDERNWETHVATLEATWRPLL